MLKNLLRALLDQFIVHKKETITTFFTSSTRCIDIALTTGVQKNYTAPANGYLVLYAGTNGGIVQNAKNELQSCVASAAINNFQGFTVATKGDLIQITTHGAGSAKFYYAKATQ